MCNNGGMTRRMTPVQMMCPDAGPELLRYFFAVPVAIELARPSNPEKMKALSHVSA
jgi:hypothetical protein